MSNMSFVLQDAASFLGEELNSFHDYSLLFVIMITSVVMFMLMKVISCEITNRFLLFNEKIEFIWTIIPSIILALLALPSLTVLYMTDELLDANLTVKAVGHQWNWSYEYSDFGDLEFSSFMTNNEGSDYRLLEVDNRMVVPINVQTRVLVTSSDVIHSWTIPSLGVKMDANPGRLNQLMIQPNRVGLFYGQCSEICGALHSFMPICVESVNMDMFSKWVKNMN